MLPQSIIAILRAFAPIGGRFEPESMAGLTGTYNWMSNSAKKKLLPTDKNRTLRLQA